MTSSGKLLTSSVTSVKSTLKDKDDVITQNCGFFRKTFFLPKPLIIKVRKILKVSGSLAAVLNGAVIGSTALNENHG